MNTAALVVSIARSGISSSLFGSKSSDLRLLWTKPSSFDGCRGEFLGGSTTYDICLLILGCFMNGLKIYAAVLV